MATSKVTKHEQSDDTHLVEAVRQSVDRIWQAGLGAFSRKQHEGEEMFSRLVQEGVAVQKRTQHLAEDRLSEMTDAIVKMAENIGKHAAGPLEKLEAVFEDRVTKSLHSIGMPTRNDIQKLSTQIGKLQEAVDEALAATKASAKGKSAAAMGNGKKATMAKTAKTAGKRSVARSTSKRAPNAVSSRP